MHKQEYINKTLVIESDTTFRGRNDLVFIDDEKMIIDNTKLPIERILYAIFAIGMGTFAIWALYKQAQVWKPTDIIGATFVILWILFCVIILINVIFNTDRKFVFNRLEGTLTMRASVLNWIPKTITIPFNEALLGYSGTPLAKSVNVSLPNSRFRYLSIMPGREQSDIYNIISFIVWYMDKNRQLPPGKDLDPYRMKDYERRKAEGFPEPLYPATIPMPDHREKPTV
ncbi:MAG: hypothetical protein E6772_18185, partial [Dysgonomonas sp.]|nr:hypothetical protein [Dysgonomonas sp.]